MTPANFRLLENSNQKLEAMERRLDAMEKQQTHLNDLLTLRGCGRDDQSAVRSPFKN
jgi:hypothetical protein